MCVRVTQPDGVSGSERSFSTLRRLKTWLGSSTIVAKGCKCVHVHCVGDTIMCPTIMRQTKRNRRVDSGI